MSRATSRCGLQALLEYRGYEVDLLPEHDPMSRSRRCKGYRGAALVSIHADSCDVAGASGFKVARWAYSDDAGRRGPPGRVPVPTSTRRPRLLPAHDDSITVDMWNYYAFREVAPETRRRDHRAGFLASRPRSRSTTDATRWPWGSPTGSTAF